MKVYEMIFQHALPYIQTRNNDIHIPVARSFAELLLTKEPGDPAIVLPAIILHDVGWSKLSKEEQLKAFGPGTYDQDLNRIHELEGVKIAQAILEQIAYDQIKTQEILNIIEGHDSRLTAISENDKLVKDADKLFRFSGGGLKFYQAQFDYDKAYLWNYFNSNLETWFFTDSAKELAYKELAKEHWK